MPQRTAWTQLKPTDLPAPPQEAIGIVHACSRPDVTSKRLAEIVTHNAVLTAELLRIVNSAFFGFRAKATSAAHAVTLLGQRALRNLALCVAMRDALRADAIPGLDMGAYWEQALRRAVAARCLARAAGLNAEDGFTAGLLQDFGLLVMLYVDPDRAIEWPRLAQADPDERYALEQTLFGVSHDRVGEVLAEAWELPPELRRVMGQHHSPLLSTNNTDDALCRVALCTDWMAAVFTAGDKRPVIRRCRQLLGDHFGLTAERVNDLLEEVSQGLGVAGAALGLRVGAQLTLADVLREANLQLVEDNLSYQELTWRLEQALAERDRIAAELNRELELAREVQRSLMPGTGGDCAGFYGMNTSARELSGDFYDYFSTPAGTIHFCIADVSGKGMNAALLMAKVSSLFRCLGKSVADPAVLLGLLNREIAETSVRGMFVTLIGGVYDPRSGRVQLANAGHLPAVFQPVGPAGRGPLQEFPADGPPLGVMADAQYINRELRLDKGTLYLFTDGLIEARAAGGAELGIAGLRVVIHSHANLPAAQRARSLLEAVRDAEVHDDLTVLIIDGGENLRGR